MWILTFCSSLGKNVRIQALIKSNRPIDSWFQRVTLREFRIFSVNILIMTSQQSDKRFILLIVLNALDNISGWYSEINEGERYAGKKSFPELYLYDNGIW